jgi:uncharacterized protein (DUF488 family)
VAKPALVRAVWTIGHSTRDPDDFVSLLKQCEIQFLIDVRSSPRSRIAPGFDRELLKDKLRANEVRYAFWGEELGGRPRERALYDESGRVRYGAVAKLPRFREAIARLIKGSDEYHIAIMCSEENPACCHRRLLVGRVLTQSEILLKHVRSDGRIEEETSVELLSSGPLIGAVPDEEIDWKSTRSVLHKKRPSNFSSGSSYPGLAH